jgi:hypothetical protein
VGAPALERVFDWGWWENGSGMLFVLSGTSRVLQAQTVAFASAAPVPAVVGETYGVTAVGGASGNSVTFSSLTPAVCAVSGSTVTFAGVGTCTVAADQAGSASYLAAPQVTQTMKVDYRFQGFAAPVANGGTLNLARTGQAIPLKWRLTDAWGAPVTTLATAAVTAAHLECSVAGTPGQAKEVKEYAAVASGLQNLGDGYYQLNWKAPSSYACTCKTLQLDLGEGSGPRTARFQFTK